MAITKTTLISRIPAIVADLPSTVKDALEESADAIAEGAKSRVPVDTGDLRDAIHVEEIENGFSVVAGDDDVFYGHIVENGGVNTPPRPFLIPAFEAERDNLLERVAEALEDM
jgi:HK97 gp10 family phage protein